jgi:uncharacterized phage-associated protein
MSQIHGFTNEQIAKLGNAIIFLTEQKPLPKTNLLKLIYLLDEISIKQYGIPFFNFNYKMWKFGPVETNIYYEFSNEPQIIKDFISIVQGADPDGYAYTLVKGVGGFDDDEFSDNDMHVLNWVKNELASKSTRILVDITHAENSPWRICAIESGHLECLENGTVNTTNVDVKTSLVIEHDDMKKMIYGEYLEQFGNPVLTQC